MVSIIAKDNSDYPELTKTLQDIVDELEKSNEQHNPSFNSTHEWYGVLKEEVDELWKEIKKNKDCYQKTFAMEKEAIQVAAMALKGILTIKHNYFKGD